MRLIMRSITLTTILRILTLFLFFKHTINNNIIDLKLFHELVHLQYIALEQRYEVSIYLLF